jgi:RNA-directed DNA polymerase
MSETGGVEPPAPTRKSVLAEAAEAKRRQEQREEERRAARLARAEAHRERISRYQVRLQREVLHAGRGVSAHLTHTTPDADRLEDEGLPVLRDAADLAALLGVDLKVLRWLTYHRDVAPVIHYRQFEVPKAKGGVRVISAPRPALRAAQQKVRAEILSHLAATPQAQGFVRARSTVTNARAHVRRDVLVKIDITDFFGTITYPRVRGLFRRLGYSGMVASLLGLLCTEAPRREVEIDGRRWYVALGERSLPQGAATSPELTNQIARGLDRRMAKFAAKHGWTYTRYADDLTFSLRLESKDEAERVKESREHVRRLLGVARAVLEDEGFSVNRDKLAVIHKGRQQRVTGVVVNDQLGIDRRTLRRFRAAVHRVSKDGFKDPAEKQRMLGYAAYVKMIKPALGTVFLTTLREAANPGSAGADGSTGGEA